jgi:hypothetical protein
MPLFIPPPSFTLSSSHKPPVTCYLCLAHAVTAVTCVILFYLMLLFTILSLDRIMGSKLSCKSDNEGKKNHKVMTLE